MGTAKEDDGVPQCKGWGILEYRIGLKIGGVGGGWSYQESPSHCCNSIRVGGMNPEFGSKSG
jgi:hypothetical protein